MPTPKSEELLALAQRMVDALPADLIREAVVTGSVSRGMADDVSDVEMLLVTEEPIELEEGFEHARRAGLTELDTWGPQGGPDRRVFGYFEGVPFELIWWPRALADERVEAILAGGPSASAEAILNGIGLRSSGLLPAWKDRLHEVPEAVAARRIEEAARPWGGFAPAGLLTIIRPGERFSLVEWIFGAAVGVLEIVYLVNGAWPPTTKRLETRAEALAVKPDRFAERIEAALTEPDPRQALLTMTELQLDAVRLAPSGPLIDRARAWLADGIEVLKSAG